MKIVVKTLWKTTYKMVRAGPLDGLLGGPMGARFQNLKMT